MPMTTVRGVWAALTIMAWLLSASGCAERQSGGSGDPETAVGQGASQDRAAPTIAYASTPASPRAGENTATVDVTDVDGSPMEGLVVTATYFMPAMPSMGMPEMRDSFVLGEQGKGRYAGEVRLSMGGSWNVSVTAVRGDATVARKQLTIVARE